MKSKQKGHRVAECYVFKQDIDAQRIDPRAYAHMTQRRSNQNGQQYQPYQHTPYQQGPQMYQSYPTQYPPTAATSSTRVATQEAPTAFQANGNTPLLPTYSVAAVQQQTQSNRQSGTRPSVSFSDPLAQTMTSLDTSMQLSDLTGGPATANQANDGKR